MDALKREEGRRVVLMFTDGKDNPSSMGVNSTMSDVIARSQREDVMVYAIGLSTPCDTPPPTVPAVAPRFETVLFQGRGRPPGGRPGGGGPRGPGRPGIPGFPGGGQIPGRRPPGYPMPPPDIYGRPGGGDGRDGGRIPPPPATTIGPCVTDKPDVGLREVAEESGGTFFELHGTDNLGRTFARVADELHRQYLLAFSAPQLDGAVHHLEVRVSQPEVSVKARKSYVAAAGR